MDEQATRAMFPGNCRAGAYDSGVSQGVAAA